MAAKFFSSVTLSNKDRSNHKVKGEPLTIKKKNLEPSPRKSSSHKSIFSLVDLWVRNEEKEKIREILRKKLGIIKRRSSLNYPVYKDKYYRFKKALIKIQDGCDKFCAYCIVPYVRGRSKSRYLDDILKEVRKLIRQGIDEIVLTGIDISAFKFKVKSEKLKVTVKNLKLNKYKNHLVRLIKVILKETKVKKISFGSIGLRVFDNEFIDLFNNLTIGQYNNRISTHFHIPLQSGCEETLKRMKRDYTVSDFVLRISDLKKKIQGFSFSTDIIVGFPGETREEFKETVKSVKSIKQILGRRFKKIHIFRYSSRKGTLAEKMEGKKGWERVDEKEKKRRAKALQFLISN